MMSLEGVAFAYANRSINPLKRASLTPVLQGIDMTLERGACFGLIGPNGSGKSTLVKIALGIHAPTRGRVLVEGQGKPSLSSEAWKERVGFVSGASTRLFSSLTLLEHFEMFRKLYRRFDEGFFTRALERCGLDRRMLLKPPSLSFGERIRFELLLTLACRPDVLMLDEPTVGLDPIALSDVRTLLRDAFGEGGVLGILTSHNLGDISLVAGKGAFLKDGRLTHAFETTNVDTSELEGTYHALFGAKERAQA